MPHFYATANDLLSVLLMVEAKRKLSYTLMGQTTSRNIEIYGSGSDLPTLHLPAPFESAVPCPGYLVTQTGQLVLAREVSNLGRQQRWTVDQLENPDSTVLWPGGVYEEDVLLYGRVDTASKTKMAQSLQRSFAAAIKNRFVRIKAFYVGEEAAALLDSGCRLTLAKQTPREYDLSR